MLDLPLGLAPIPRPGLTLAAGTALRQFSHLRPSGGFDLIMADPPWKFETRSPLGQNKSADAHYDCMGIGDIEALPVSALAAADCLLWLWATGPLLREALGVIDAWGFTYKTQGYWAKTTRHGKQTFGTGYLLRNAGEPFLIATKGAPKTARNVRSVIMGRVREHSRKPEEAFAEAEKLMPEARRIEVFSRASRRGWATWGNETAKFDPSDMTERKAAMMARLRASGDKPPVGVL